MPVKLWLAALVVAGGVVASGAAMAAGVMVPQGFRTFCTSHPGDCQGGGAAEVPMTGELMALLKQVNGSVNASIVPVKREVPDVWSVAPKRGDCEDYVLTKRRALIRDGVPASALRIVYALRGNDGHAVLAVNTTDGEFALDNLTGAIRPLDSTGYLLISESGPNPKIWNWI